MQIIDLGFARTLRTSTTREHARQAINGLLLPRAYLIGVHPVLRRVHRENSPPDCFLTLLTLDGSVATQRLKRNLGLKLV